MAITRNMFVPMLVYYGYSLTQVAYVIILSGVLGVLISLLMYRYPQIVSRNPKSLLLTTHVLERVSWFTLPLLLDQPILLSIMYGVAQSITIPVGVLLNYALLALFSEERDFTDITILRTAGGSASSILGLGLGVYISTYISPPEVYILSYLTAFVVGILGSISLLPINISERESVVRESLESYAEEVEIRKINTFTMLSLMNIGASILGIAWTPLLRELGAPLNIPITLGLVGSIGGVIGPYIWKGYKMYLLAMLINAITVVLIPLTPLLYLHLLYSFILSATFVGANLIGASIYSRYVRSIGIVRASTFLTASAAVGMLASSIVGVFVRGDILIALLISSITRFAATAIAGIAIPETAIVPREVAYGYARLIYTTTILGYTFTVETSIRTLKLTLQIIAFTVLLTLIYIIYRLGFILYKGV